MNTKYYLIKNDLNNANAQFWRGKIVEYISEDGMNYKICSFDGVIKYNRMQVLLLAKPFKTNKVYVRKETLMDITEVWTKMDKMYNALNGIIPMTKLVIIMTAFEQGDYPTLKDFQIMNKLWIQYITKIEK